MTNPDLCYGLMLGPMLLLFVACAAVAAPSHEGASFRKVQDGVVFDLMPGTLKLQVCDERTVRVLCGPGALPQKSSYVVVGRWPAAPFKVSRQAGEVVLRTAKLRVGFDLAQKRLTFRDARGRVLLREVVDGRRFTKFRYGSQVTQEWEPNTSGEFRYVNTPLFGIAPEERFEMSPGEAFYGLGEHQIEPLNLRGESFVLQQDNTVDVTPFIVSSRGYGLLWDNAACTTVDLGSPMTAIPLPCLLDADGKPGALTGEYFDGQGFERPVGSRRDAGVDFVWTGKAPIEGLKPEHYSVRWTGHVVPRKTGDTTFVAEADDGMRLWVNGEKVIDDWATRPIARHSARVHLTAGKPASIRLEFYQDAYDAVVRLRWREPQTAQTMRWRSETGGAIDYTFMYGPELDKVVGTYRAATGAAPMFPKWAYGLFQCRERYSSQDELLNVVREYRAKRFPLDVIVQDWFYWNPYPWGSHRLDEKRYPDFAGTVRELHEKLNTHVMISVWAKFEPGSDNAKELEAKGCLYPEAPGAGARYYDAFNPVGRETYWRQMRDQLFSKGVDAWWLDATEPEVPMDWYRSVKTAMGRGAEVLNAYSLMTTKAVYEGQRAADPSKRVFILTRSVYAGQQRNGAATWSGDITGSWPVFRKQIAGGLNFSLSGVPYWTTDIGGFFGGDPKDPAYRELFLRWFEWGVFCPIFRVHGTGPAKEFWRFGPEAEAIQLKTTNLRYRLMPYLYSLAWRVTSQGDTIMRPLAMDFRDEPGLLGRWDEFMFGPSILVCPVTEAGAARRSVVLPKGAWIDFWTGQRLAGGKTVQADAPLERIPLFLRAGAILPMGPYLQYASEKKADPIELRVATGANGRFTLYEDSGDGYGYEKGERATIPIRWNEKAKTLTIGARQGAFPGMLEHRTFHVVCVRPGHGTGVGECAAPDATIHYDGRAVSTKLK